MRCRWCWYPSACHSGSVFSFEKLLTMPVLQQWPVYSTFSQHKMLFLCCWLRNSKTTVTVLSWPVSYQVIALLFAIFYLSWESPFINILLIFLCSPPWCLISYQALLLMGYHNAQEVSCLPGLFITGQFLWRKPENQEIFWIKLAADCEAAHVFLFSLLEERKGISVNYSK